MPSTPPHSTCGCAFILKGIKSSKQALTLLLMHERFWTSVKNLPSSKAVSLCLAEEVIGCPQLGHGARRVCMPELIAHGLPCKCPGYPRITYHIPPNGSTLVRAGVLPLSWKSATAGVLVPSSGDCPGSGWLKDKPGHLYACITYWMLKGH